jgi:hypothetical protein
MMREKLGALAPKMGFKYYTDVPLSLNLKKYNENHDELGRFAEGGGGDGNDESFGVKPLPVTPAGSGTSEHAAIVAKRLDLLPPSIRDAMARHGIRVSVGQNSVTDVMPELSGVKPRGWPEGMTWDSVPGLYDNKSKTVVAAMRNGQIPEYGNGHGSADLLLHEALHGYDRTHPSGGSYSSTLDFMGAYRADKSNMTAYHTQAGTAGRQEAFAEYGAQYFSGKLDRTKLPNMYNYWSRHTA